MNSKVNKKSNNKMLGYMRKYMNIQYGKELLLNPDKLPIISYVILLAELVLNIFIIRTVPYTEIDWKAYMQECEGFLNGTFDYSFLKGAYITYFLL